MHRLVRLAGIFCVCVPRARNLPPLRRPSLFPSRYTHAENSDSLMRFGVAAVGTVQHMCSLCSTHDRRCRSDLAGDGCRNGSTVLRIAVALSMTASKKEKMRTSGSVESIRNKSTRDTSPGKGEKEKLTMPVGSPQRSLNT